MSQKRRGFEAGLSQSDTLAEKRADDGTAASRSLSSSFRSSPVTDRASTFVAVFSKSDTVKQLQDDPAFRSATHRIAAWRHTSRQRSLTPQRPVYDTGFDDDGEKYAGKRLERLLTTLGICGVVVVARWYGGVMLGPIRFEHIENCAREAIELCQASERGQPMSAKRPRLETAAAAATGDSTLAVNRILNEDGGDALRKKLSDTLERRDESITALRKLLTEKQDRLAVAAKTITAVKKPQYSNLNLEALRRLEKARDSTIAWLLKEIDKAEADNDLQQEKAESLETLDAPEEESFAVARASDEIAKLEAELPRPGPPIGDASVALGSAGSLKYAADAASSDTASALPDASSQR